MYELFEFVRVFSVKSSRPEHHNGKVDIIKFAWKEEGEISFLALLCSNDFLLLRYDVTGHPPIIKQLPWLPQEEIVSMCFDPMMTCLLIVTANSNKLFIIPALSLVNPGAAMNQIFAKDDVTVRGYDSVKGAVCCTVWWQTLEGKQIAVVATTVGELIFIDLLNTEEPETRLTIDATITDLSLSYDDSQMNTTLLITTITGNQWHLLLETRTTETAFSPDSDLSDMGYDHIDGRSIPPRSILDATEENSIIFSPSQFQIFQPPTLLKPQFAKGHHFITAHCTSTSTLQVMDPSAEHSPLFVYKLPADADRAILTDMVIFTTINHSRDRKLIVLSNQKAENSGENQQEFDAASVLQEFVLPEDEILLGVERKRFPFYFHEHRENENVKWLGSDSSFGYPTDQSSDLDSSVFSIPVRVHTVLDGCMIVTNSSLYEIRPRVSPERLFLHLALTLPETTIAEDLAISIGLDLTTLSELGAEYMLKQSQFSKAMKLYTLSKRLIQCPATKRTGNLARHGCISEVTVQLRQVLSSPGYDLNPMERKFLSNMLLHCFIYQLQRGRSSQSNLMAGLKDFLSGSFSFDEQTALNLLSEFKHVDLLLSLAKARGLIMDALQLLVKAETFQSVTFSSLCDLVHKGFTAHLIQSELLLPCLAPEDLLNLLITRPQLAIQNHSIIRPLLASLRPSHLLELARIFDPSKCVMKGILTRLQTSRKRANSLTSICSISSESVDVTGDQQMESLLEFFLLVVLQLNRRRRLDNPQPPHINFDLMVGNDLQEVEQKVREEETSEIHVQLTVQHHPVSCGPKHAAAIRNGDLYTWGRSLHGRLGHGEVPQAVCAPARVETLHMLRMKVEAVSCGSEHTLALTHQGVYGWGNSKYGQVGVGTNHLYRRPMLLEALMSETVVAISCGLYHSLALTMDHQVYSWGWGVHGQLGHGDIEDGLIPRHVKALLGVKVIRIAGGYAHSLVLNADGQLWTFGCGYFGQLGTGSSIKSSLPLKIEEITEPVKGISTKYFHSLAVTENNRVYLWGSHPHNLRQAASSIRQARHMGRQVPSYNPFMLPSLVDLTYVQGKIVKVCCGTLHNLLLTDDGCIYVWGRNLEGQLGTGSRQDESIPKMLTSLNNQQVLMADSGGEFTVAIDSEGTVWLWGKNDMGQLGYLKPRRENRIVNKQQAASSGGNQVQKPTIHGQSSECMTPTTIRGLPKVDPANQAWITMLDAINEDKIWMETENCGNHSVISAVPNLDHFGQGLYPSTVVPVTLKACENLMSTKYCLQKCLDFKDWITAAQICDVEADYVEALYYRFQFVAEVMTENPTDEVINLCIDLVSHHIKLVLDKKMQKLIQTKELTSLCGEALQFWQRHNLPINKLEFILSQHLAAVSSWLLRTILHPPMTHRKVKGDENEGPAPRSLLFSTQFSLQVLNFYMTTPGMASSDDLDMTKALSSGKTVRPTGAERSNRLHNLTSKDRLWIDILKNMKKDPGYISLTHSQVDHMLEQGQSFNDKQTESKFVVFTCGHHYPETVFTTETVPAMSSQLLSGSRKLQNSTPLLQYLLLRPGLKAMACPKCITQGLFAS